MIGARALVPVALLSAAIGWTAVAGAQQDPRPGTAPLLVEVEAADPSRIPPLSADQATRLHEARQARSMGRFEQAGSLLDALERELPHHPLVLVERVRLMLARGEWAAAERLARAERASQRDSVLLAHEHVMALEQLDRPRDAARVAIEAWAASVAENAWGSTVVMRLLATDPRGIRDAMRRAASRVPHRVDLLQGLARVEWRMGNVREAVEAVSDADAPGGRPLLRWSLADEMLRASSAADSAAALAMFMDLVADTRHEPVVRLSTARRAWGLIEGMDDAPDGAKRLTEALADLPGGAWPSDLLIAVAHGLQAGGRHAEARALLDARSDSGDGDVRIALERALATLREGPAERALPDLHALAQSSDEGAFRFAEGLFFAGLPDSALAWYQRASQDPQAEHAGAALERAFLIEESSPPEAARAFGAIAYARWRGDTRAALARADSLYGALAHGPTWAMAAMLVSDLAQAAGEREHALEPALALAEAMPGDRLAPKALQRAGDLYLALGRDAEAVEQYEECLTRYPRAWNAPEVRRTLDTLRRERRF